MTSLADLPWHAPRERVRNWLPRVRQLIAPVKPVAANLASIPLTVAGIGCVDFAAFHLAHGWGWLATGASLVVIEHLIADER